MSNAIIMQPVLPAAYGSQLGTLAGVPSNAGNDFFGVTWSGQPVGGNSDIWVDLGSNQLIDTIAILGIRDVTGGAPQFQIGASTAAQGLAGVGTWYSTVHPLFAGSNALTNGRQAMLWTAPAAAGPPASRHWQIVAQGVGAGFRISRIVLGRRIALARNFSFGAGFGVRSFGSVNFSNRAALIRRRAPKLRTVSLSFQNIYRDEVEAQIQPLIETIGIDDPILLITDLDAHAMRTRRMFFGHLEGDLKTVQRNAVGWQWQADLTSLF